MSLKANLRSVGAALRRGSPVVVDVPAGVRCVLLQRYMDLSMRNGRLSLGSFAILLFGFAYEAPLWPRLAAWAVLAAVFAVRVRLARRMLHRLDPADPRPDRLYDALVLLASSVWGLAPIALQPWLSQTNLFCTIYAAFVATSLLTVTYFAALPAGVTMVGASVLPLIAFMLMQGSVALAVLALGTIVCVAALLLRVVSVHETLLAALASERQNAALVQELQLYRRMLETENATLGSSLRDASQAANRDPLTGLFNRRHLDGFTRPLGELVRAHQEEVSLCMIDVDHFKQVNDRHGHRVGDDVLKAVGQLLGARLRDGDCLARLGGEEFLVLLRNCNVSRARRVAESLRHNVAASQIHTDAGEVPVTVSVGVAQWADDEDFDAVVGRADRALYEAKHSGRDRVEIDQGDARRIVTLPPDSLPSGTLH
ncbi:MAG: GGDEF domain-containing protein [Proteobacteria bacterium]|nr:GGDEF domain-containing protein [Pseudomonadota bacterium]